MLWWMEQISIYIQISVLFAGACGDAVITSVDIRLPDSFSVNFSLYLFFVTLTTTLGTCGLSNAASCLACVFYMRN